ncbi:MAG: molecular chaperone HtpG [Clostridia bacterium]|nr:molecular chaperone HtpG [Clostridia bacterium]
MSEQNRRGEISVTTEHIFPIIKRWLYSDKDIFLRELVSNASDAITKLCRLRSLGETEAEGEGGRIDVVLDESAGTLVVRDNGIGMSAEEVERYLNQIALSGALEFIERYEGEGETTDGIIGHFGLGFYSAFMVASRVEVLTKSHTSAPAVLWSCTDAGVFEMKEAQRDGCGTDVILYLTEDEREYLKREKCAAILEKYCSFLTYPIYLSTDSDEGEEAPINETEPLWMKSPSSITDDEYREFYHKLFGYRSEPLFWVHLNADYPLNFKGILYFPRLNNQFDSMEGEVKLFYNRVFVADNIPEVVPEYLLSLKGVLDCPELPLNVSRSFLQNSPYVAKLSAHIAKKVADKLSELFRGERERFESITLDLRPFLQYGAIKDEKFFSRVKDLILFECVDGGYVSVSEYLASAEDQKIYYTTDKTRQAQYVKLLTDEGRRVILFESVMDTQYASLIERDEEGVKFVRVDSDPESLKETDAETDETLVKLFSEIAGEGSVVECVRLKDEATPALFVTEENARRMEEVLRMYRARGGEEMPPMPKQEKLLLNLASPVFEKIKGNGERAEVLARQVYYTALISSRALTAEELSAFLENNHRLMNF